MSPPGPVPRLRVENGLRDAGYRFVVGLDEVGRGALCGPVTIGAVVLPPPGLRPPRGLRDSKLLPAQQRRRLVPRIRDWSPATAVAHASPAEIDQMGIIAALRLAAHRALRALPVPVDIVVLDGNYDYVTQPDELDLFGSDWLSTTPAVHTVVKGDQTCATVAAASVLAKTTRDALMCELAGTHPEYGWTENMGYATPAHREALRRLGPSPQHRQSWRLGVDGPIEPSRAAVTEAR